MAPQGGKPQMKQYRWHRRIEGATIATTAASIYTAFVITVYAIFCCLSKHNFGKYVFVLASSNMFMCNI